MISFRFPMGLSESATTLEQSMELYKTLGVDAAIAQAIAGRFVGAHHDSLGQAHFVDRLFDGFLGQRRSHWHARSPRRVHSGHQIQSWVPKHIHKVVFHVWARNIPHQIQGSTFLLMRLVFELEVSFAPAGKNEKQALSSLMSIEK